MRLLRPLIRSVHKKRRGPISSNVSILNPGACSQRSNSVSGIGEGSVQAHASANKRTPADAPRLTVPSRDCPRHDMLCTQPALYSACAVMHAVGTENRFSGCKAHMHSTAVNNNHTFCSRWRASTQRRINDCASLRSARSPKLPKAVDTCLQRFTRSS